MGHYFDFAPIQPWAGLGADFDGLASALGGRRKRADDQRRLEIEDARQRASQAFMEAQAKAADTAQRARERREGIEFQQRQAKMRGDTVRDIGKALGAGAFGQAQAIGAASQFPDPRTGEMEGVSVRQKPLPQEPGAAPAEPQAPDFVGPLETPEMARTRAIGKVFGAGRGYSQRPGTPALSGKYGLVEQPGVIESGNVDLTNRPDVLNADGTHSSVRSMSFEENGREILVPTVSDDGRIMSDEEAIAQYHRTGRHLGMFRTPGEATAYAQRLHEQQEGMMRRAATEPPPFDPEAAARAQREGDAAASEVTQQQSARDAFADESAAFPGAQADHQRRSAAYNDARDNPQYQIGMPGGQSIDVDPRDAKRAQQMEARETAGRLRTAASQPGQDPAVAGSMLRQADLIEAQITNADKAPITNMAGAVQSQGFKADESAKDRANRVEVAKTRARGKALGAKGSGGSDRGAHMAELVEMRERGESEGAIARKAAEYGIPAGGTAGYLGAIKEVRSRQGGEFKQNERTASLQATDENGKPIGQFKGPTDAKTAATQQARFAQVKDRLQALINDVKTNGNRVIAPDSVQRRVSLGESVVAAMRPYNELGSTDASVKLEKAIVAALGAPGHGFLMGANPEILQHLLDEASHQHEARLNVRLRAGSGPAPSAGLTSVKMPDGSVQQFDASGKRVK